MDNNSSFGICFPKVRFHRVGDSHLFRDREWLRNNSYREDFDDYWYSQYDTYVPVYTSKTYTDGIIRNWVRRQVADATSTHLTDKALVFYKDGKELRCQVLGRHVCDDSVVIAWPTCDAYELCAFLMARKIEFSKMLTIENVMVALCEVFGYENVVRIR